MKTEIIDGKSLALEIQEGLSQKIKTFTRPPKLAVVLVGDDPASHIYVRNKAKAAEKVGISAETFCLSSVLTQDALVSFIQDLNQNPDIDGILVQLPLPKHINENLVIEAIDPKKDVDGLSTRNLGRLFVGQPCIVPCTPLACMELLRKTQKNTDGLNAVIIGRSRLVGKPLAQLLLSAQCTVTQAHTHTRDLPALCRTADILVVAAGKQGLVRRDFIKPGAIIIDVGINRDSDGKVCGDVLFDEVNGVAGFVTPVPGGVGPMTVTMLLKNVVDIYLKKEQKKLFI